MKRMRVLFLSFIFLVVIGMLLLMNEAPFIIGWAIFGAGVLSGIVCALTNCPCCSKPSGVFFKYAFGGVFPLGICAHCGKSYLRSRGCENDS
jgi:hypothetical protein